MSNHKRNASKWLNRTDNASEQKCFQVIIPQKTRLRKDQTTKTTPPKGWNRKDGAPSGPNRKRRRLGKDWTAKTTLPTEQTAKTTPPTDRTTKDTPPKGSNRKDDAPNGPNHKRHASERIKPQKTRLRKDQTEKTTPPTNREWAISALATAQASLQPSTS
jgi:hypothetical protein